MSVRDTIVLGSSDLKYLLIDSLKLYSDNVVYISGRNPYRFSINKKTFYILIKNIHESGRGRGNPDECRIQISKTKNFNEALSSNFDVIVLGYFADENVFTAWNPYILRDRFNKKPTVSVYSRFTAQTEASQNKIAAFKNNNDESIISFKPDYLGLYLDNISNIHLLSDEDLKSLVERSDNSNESKTDSEEIVNVNKEEFTITHRRYKRDSRFRTLVYQAYNNRCAMCGIQLELIEAAHIVPHSHEFGTDDVNNGVALCSLHHKAYDQSLIYFDEKFNVKINESKMEYLEKIGKDSGYRKFQSLNFEKLILPISHTLLPSESNITLANSIRGI